MNGFKKWLVVVLSVFVVSFMTLFFLKGMREDFNISLLFLICVALGVVYASLSALIDKFMCTKQ